MNYILQKRKLFMTQPNIIIIIIITTLHNWLAMFTSLAIL